MITVEKIFNFLCMRYPLDTACDFDNAGLLVGDKNAPVTKAIVCLDCDKTVVDKAINGGAQLIITHHPLIWDGLKSVTAESLVFRLIKAGIAVISMHTNLDVGAGGVNDCLCTALGLSDVKTHIAQEGYALRYGKIAPKTAESFAADIKARLGGTVRFTNGGKMIERVLVCSGSGGSYLDEALSGGFDALVTADVKHNVFIDAVNAEFSIFDAGHFDTENVVCAPLAKELSEQFDSVLFEAFTPDAVRSI